MLFRLKAYARIPDVVTPRLYPAYYRRSKPGDFAHHNITETTLLRQTVWTSYDAGNLLLFLSRLK